MDLTFPYFLIFAFYPLLVSCYDINQNGVILKRDANGQTFVNVTINSEARNLLFDTNTPILWYTDNSNFDSQSPNFTLMYNRDHVNGSYSSSNKFRFMASTELKNETLGIVRSSDLPSSFFGSNNSESISGVFGHSFANPIFPDLFSDLNDSQVLVTMFSERDTLNSKTVSNTSAGVVIYGSSNFEELITENVYFTQSLLSDYYSWIFGISDVKVGGSGESIHFDDLANNDNNSRVSIIDFSNENIITTEFNDSRQLHKKLFDTYSYNDTDEAFYIGCDGDFPTLQLKVGSMYWNITKDEYLIKTDGLCKTRFGVYNKTSSDGQSHNLYNEKVYHNSNFWILGCRFFENISVVFNFDSNLIGFSKRAATNFVETFDTPSKSTKSTSDNFSTLLNVLTSYNTQSDTVTVVQTQIIYGTLESSFSLQHTTQNSESGLVSSQSTNGINKFTIHKSSVFFNILLLLLSFT